MNNLKLSENYAQLRRSNPDFRVFCKNKKRFQFLKPAFLIFFILIFLNNASAQRKNKNIPVEIATWTIIQAIPSSFFYDDNNSENARLQYGFQWNVSPVNYSFCSNKLVTPLQFFIVNPVRRYGGSAEIFVQPSWTTSDYLFAGLKRFQFSAGARIYIPAIEAGEYLSFSAGAKYRLRKNNSGINENTYAAEISAYSFYGILGFQFDYNFNDVSRYDFGITLKYY